MKKIFIILIVLLMRYGVVEAATCTHYASPTGSANWASATNISTPTSISTAISSADSGNVVCFRGGNYYFPPSTSYEVPPYRMYHSGTQANPIIFQAYTGETPVWVGDKGWPPNDTVLMFANGHSDGSYAYDWVTVDGITFEAFEDANGSGTRRIPEVLFTSPSSGTAANCVIKNCTFIGTTTTIQDNHHMIWIGGATGNLTNNVTVSNNLFRDMIAYSGNSDYHGIAAIMTYGYGPSVEPYNITINNNEFRNCSTGVYFKGNAPPGRNFSIYNNYFNGVETAVAYNPNGGDNMLIYNNVMVLSRVSGASDRSLAGVNLRGYQVVSTGNSVYNNTIYTADATSGLTMGIGGFAPTSTIYNNILKMAISTAGYDSGPIYFFPSSTFNAFDHNNFGNSSFSIYLPTTTFTSISVLESTNIMIDTNNNCSSRHPCGNLASDPLFTNGSGSYSLLSDFNLQAGSPSKGTGRGGLDMGANISLVGTTGSSTGGGASGITIPGGVRIQ